MISLAYILLAEAEITSLNNTRISSGKDQYNVVEWKTTAVCVHLAVHLHSAIDFGSSICNQPEVNIVSTL